MAWEYNLNSMAPTKDVWRITSQELGITSSKPFSITTRRLHGGRQEGVTVIEIDNGKMKVRVCPTRGMAPLDAVSGSIKLGWQSPVKEIVNPAFINLESRGGLGWLDGFNELVVRCGYEWTGHPGMDKGEMLTLHGRAQNTPATDVKITIDEAAPHAIRISGLIREQMFKKVNFVTRAELITYPNSSSFRLHDVLTNEGDYAREYQVIYHSNFGPPILGKDAKFSAPVRQVSPFNEYAKKDLATWKTYRGPTRGFDEMVYNVYPYGDGAGNTLAVLSSAAGDKGVSMGFNITQLPVFSLWKNTDTLGQGYVTGLEPGTSLAYPRVLQRKLGLVPTIAAKGSKSFDVTYTLLDTPAAVKGALSRVATIQGKRKTTVVSTPPADESKMPK
ncbi:DUF4432 family protein [bacterium]|nr:MAG: DUF4432 family protein [bacterium]